MIAQASLAFDARGFRLIPGETVALVAEVLAVPEDGRVELRLIHVGPSDAQSETVTCGSRLVKGLACARDIEWLLAEHAHAKSDHD